MSGDAGTIDSGWRFRAWLIAAALLLAVVGAFTPVLKGDFLYFDDQLNVTANPHVRTGLCRANLIWGATLVKYFWHPLFLWSLMLDAQIFGDHAAGFHLTNLAWHGCNVLLFFAVLTKMTGDLWPSALAAGLFAVHPLNVEAVAWISERKGVLSTCFWILSLLAYARYAAKPGPGRYLVTLLAMVLGLMAKPMLVTHPFVLLLLDFWPLSRMGTRREPGVSASRPAGTSLKAGMRTRRLGRLVAEKLPLLLVAIVFSGVAIVAQDRGGTLPSGEKLILSSRLKNAALSYVIYLKQAVLPVDLAAFYPHPEDALKTGPAVAAALAIAAVTLATLRWRYRAPYLLVGWLWYLVSSIPVIGLVQVGSHARADRYTYVPMIGIFIAVSWLVADLSRRWHLQRASFAAAAVVLSFLMAMSWVQCQYWRNTVTLWEHALQVTKNNYLAHNNLAIELMKQGKNDSAMRHFQEALAIKPGYAYALNGVAILAMQQGDSQAAVRYLQAASRSQPTLALTHFNLGVVYANLGHNEQAAGEFRRCLHLDGEYPDAHLYLGRILLMQGRADEAAETLASALVLNPGNEDSRLLLEWARLRRGQEVKEPATTKAR
ncbi:MAG: tetratricopeptide repeat protein [Planctomycetaceae bacterium]|nr:tetratricopeptide repeat protein [Planctomycetaceae bacterium]